MAISGGNLYAVNVQGGSWLPPVSGYNIKDANKGYAGIMGKTIDTIMISGRSYAVSISWGSSGGGDSGKKK